MPNFKIQLRTPDHVREAFPVESDDHTALRVELARFVGGFLKEHAEAIWADEEWRVDVTDENGLILYALEIQATDTPATMKTR